MRLRCYTWLGVLLCFPETILGEAPGATEGMVVDTEPAPPEFLGATLFCFAVTMPTGHEPRLIKEQYASSSGLFACDGHLLFSNVSSATLFNKRYENIFTAVIPGQLPLSTESRPTHLRTKAFLTIWGQLFADGRFEDYAWTVKVEVDTLFLPQVLRGLVSAKCERVACGPAYLQSAAGSLPGAIVVLSQPAMLYVARMGEHCASLIEHSDKTEAQYLSACLDSLMITALEEPLLLQVARPAVSGQLCNGSYAAFYPVKSWEDAEECLRQMRRAPPKVRGERKQQVQ